MNGSRVVIVDQRTGETKTKSSSQIIKENEELSKQLNGLRQKDEKLKKAIREDNFSKIASDKVDPKQELDMGDDEILDLREQETEDEKPKEENDMADTVIARRHVSLKFGVVGSGQAGGRVAEVFSKYGYQACAINTASQDLEYLELDESAKYLIDNKELGGTGKDLDISAQCFEEREEQIREFVDSHTADAEALVLAVSGGGGTGSGSAELLSTWLYETGKPVIVIYILPGSFDDPQAKHNAITTLDRLADMASQQLISSLVLVDNANIELAYPHLSQAAFFKTANQAVVEPLHMFNSVSVSPTNYEALDSMDFAKSLIDAGNCVVFGTNKVSKEWYEDDDTALMEAIIEGLHGGLLASGFDLKEAQTVGILVTAKQSVLEAIPFSSIAYMFKYISDEYDSAKSFKGVYAVPSDSDDITIRFIFSGMGLPKERVSSLKTESEKHMKALLDKKKATNMKVGLGKDKATSQIDRNIAKIKKSKSSIGKLLGGGKKVKRRR
jgi:cell division GTPase FtsZ